MEKNEIKEKIRFIINEVSESIINLEMKEIFKNKTFLTGGCFKSLYYNEEVNDYDFYFVDEESAIKFKKLIDNGLSNSNIFTDKTKLRLNFKYSSQFAISFLLDKKIKIQFITKYFGVPEKVTNNFDFEHTTNYYLPSMDVLCLETNTLDKKELIFNEKASHPINAMKRMQKFIQQGWTINDINLMKIALCIHKLDLDDEDVYHEQSSGMYLHRESTMSGYNSKRIIG